MLASRAHIKIGSFEYLLDQSVDPHYVHTLRSLFDAQAQVTGGEGARSIHSDRLLWMFSNWAGGEGNRIYYPDQPTVYDFSDGLNGRIPGQLTGRPTREVDALTVTDGTKRVYMVGGDGSLWTAGSIEIFESTDGTTWTSRASGLVIGTARRITAVAGEDNYLYYAAWDSAGSGTRILRRMTAGGTAEDVESSATSKKPYMGMAFLNGRLYAWTGRKLFELDVFETVPLAAANTRKIMDTGADLSPDAGASSWWADCIQGENAIYFFTGSDGVTQVWEGRTVFVGDSPTFRAGPLWALPYGFTGKSITFENGILWVAGHWGTENTAGRGAMYALPLDTMRPIFVGWFRKQQDVNLQMQEIARSYGNQIIVAAASTGRVFVYDAEFNAISMLDDLEPTDFTNNDHKIGALYTWGQRRFAAVYRPGTAGTEFKVFSWKDDEPGNRETVGSLSTTLEMPEWDYDLPLETKALMGFHVAFKPLVANQRIIIAYQVDQDGVWTTAGTLTNASSGNATGRSYIQVSDATTTKKFFRMKWRVTLDNNATTTVAQPILYAVTAESRLLAFEETWDLVVRVKDEENRTRPSHRRWFAEQLRENLIDLAENKNVVTLLDGYRSKNVNEYTTHTVVVENPQDIIAPKSEGVMRIRLRSVPA